jgi:hypothetical protein
MSTLDALLLYLAIRKASVPYLGQWYAARHALRLTRAAVRAEGWRS